MNVKNSVIMEIVGAWEKQKQKANGSAGMCLPAKAAWTRRVNLERLGEARMMIQKALAEVQQKYSDDSHSEPIGDGGERRVKKEFIGEFMREQADILTQETDVAITKIRVEDLNDINLTDADMDTLAFMIEED